jgi:O-acetyl-ADP-ribose deacetylase (regulator of RNase III)
VVEGIGYKVDVGGVQVTDGHDLPVDHIIHAIGPRYHFGARCVLPSLTQDQYRSIQSFRRARKQSQYANIDDNGPRNKEEVQAPEMLRAVHTNIMQAAVDLGVDELALPAISCGVNGYPPDEAAHIAVDSCLEHIQQAEQQGALGLVEFVLFEQSTWDAWSELLLDTSAEALHWRRSHSESNASHSESNGGEALLSLVESVHAEEAAFGCARPWKEQIAHAEQVMKDSVFARARADGAASKPQMLMGKSGTYEGQEGLSAYMRGTKNISPDAPGAAGRTHSA